MFFAEFSFSSKVSFLPFCSEKNIPIILFAYTPFSCCVFFFLCLHLIFVCWYCFVFFVCGWLQSWAFETIVATIWPCFKANKMVACCLVALAATFWHWRQKIFLHVPRCCVVVDAKQLLRAQLCFLVFFKLISGSIHYLFICLIDCLLWISIHMYGFRNLFVGSWVRSFIDTMEEKGGPRRSSIETMEEAGA